jgi:glycosyltransferase involved in cell wall biosynthesis
MNCWFISIHGKRQRVDLGMFNYFQARLDNYWRSRQKSGGRPPVPSPLLGLLPEGVIPRGRALLVFLPDPIRDWLDGKEPRFFNPHGACLEWAKGLLRQGFQVDVIHYEDRETQITGDYQLVVAHVGPAISRIIPQLPPHIPVIRYATTAQWRWFDEQTVSRYQDLAIRRGISDLPLPTRLLCHEEEETLDQRANVIASLGEMTTRKFREAGFNAICINNAAYIYAATDEEIAHKVNRGRGFLYQGGIACVQKGLDLLIEAFAQEPDAHLYLDTWIEDDVLNAYRRELASPNIHFVRLTQRLERVRNRVDAVCPFLILAGLNSGQSTAMVAGTARGRIPVVAETADIPWTDGVVRIDASDVDSIRHAIRTAAALSDQELLRMSMATRDGFNRYFTPQAFASSLDRVLHSVNPQ